MHKLGSLRGVGSLCLDGELIGKAEYEIDINQSGNQTKLAFGWMVVNAHVVALVDQSIGDFTLDLANGAGTVQLALGEISGNTIQFDVSGPVPGY
jgi:hypothetical protein